MKKSIFLIAAVSLLLVQCSRPNAISGGSTTTDNAQITGKAFYPTGLPALGAVVRMRTSNYLQPIGTAPDSLLRYNTIVDDSGRFFIDSVRVGNYKIEINDSKTSAALMPCVIKTTHDNITLPDDTLRHYSTISGKVDSLNSNEKAYVQVVGLERLVPVDSTGSFIISDLPASTYRIQVISVDASVKPIVVDSVKTAPDSVTHVLDTTKTDSIISPVVGSWVQTNYPFKDWSIISLAAFPDGKGGTRLFVASQIGVYYSSDNGDSWLLLKNGLTDIMVESVAALGSYLFAGTISAGVFRSADSGANWAAVNNGLTGVRIFKFVEKNGVLFALTDGGLCRTADSGNTWTLIGNGIDQTGPTAAVFKDTIFFGANNSGIYRSFDYGVSWAKMSTSWLLLAVQDMAAIGNSLFIAAQNGGSTIEHGVYVSNDNGVSWTAINNGFSDLTMLYIQLLVVSGANLFTATYYTGVFVRANNGTSAWITINDGLPAMEVDALAASPDSAANRFLFAGIPNYGVWKIRLK